VGRDRRGGHRKERDEALGKGRLSLRFRFQGEVKNV